MVSCGPTCDTPEPRLRLDFSTSLFQDTISVGDSIKVKMEFSRFLESQDHPAPIDMIDQEWHINYTAARLDTLAMEEYVFRHDQSVEFDLVQGEFWVDASLSNAIAPVFIEMEDNFVLEFDLVFNSPGIFLSTWSYNFAIRDDELLQLECDQEVLWNFTQTNGDSNHHLFEFMPDEHIFKEQFLDRKDIDGIFAVVVE